jgi:hypothetical protein
MWPPGAEKVICGLRLVQVYERRLDQGSLS